MSVPPAADDRVVEAERLVSPVAARIYRGIGRSVPLEDLCSMGRPAAVASAQKWDGRGSFPAFVAQRIKWAILDGVRHEQKARPLRDRRFAIQLGTLVSAERAADALLRVDAPDGDTSEDRRSCLATLLRSAALSYAFERSAAVSDLSGIADARTDVEDEVERVRLRRAVGDLPDPQRAVVERHHYAGETFEEIAAALGMKRSTVFNLHGRAVERLREIFDSSAPAPDDGQPSPAAG